MLQNRPGNAARLRPPFEEAVCCLCAPRSGRKALAHLTKNTPPENGLSAGPIMVACERRTRNKVAALVSPWQAPWSQAPMRYTLL